MIYVIIGMSLLFIAIGYIVTENNAKYLLSGYNTMTEEERKKVDIHSYIPYFKKFHVFLGVSLFIAGLFIVYFLNEAAGVIFISTYPIVAYIYFVWNSRKFSHETSKKWYSFAILLLAGPLLFIIILFFMGSKENRLLIGSNQIELKGSYGELLNAKEISNIELTSQLPEITMRTNGFALGEIRKGYFKTKEGETIKLILNSSNKPYISITKQSGNRIFYSAKHEPNEKIYQRIRQALPGITANLTHE